MSEIRAENPETQALDIPDDMPSIYANSIHVRVSGADVSLLFCREDAELDGAHVRKLPLARVYLSHAQGWLLTQILSRVLKEMVKKEGLFLVQEETLCRLGLEEAYQELRALANGD